MVIDDGNGRSRAPDSSMETGKRELGTTAVFVDAERLHYTRDGSAGARVIRVYQGVEAKVIGQQVSEGNFERSSQAIGQRGCAGLNKPVVLP